VIKFYRFSLSGHSHRVELMLNLLNLTFEPINVDLANGAQKQPEFLAMNPFGSVPVIDDNGTIIADSNAIIVYLARKYGGDKWLPNDPAKAADVQRWLSIAAGEIAYGPAAARLVTVFGASLDHEGAKDKANTLFVTMDHILSSRNFLNGSDVTIADVAGYSYIAHAPEGGVSLDSYLNIKSWLGRIEALDGFVGMPETKVGLAA
jgi:glutathione S-transferase